MWHGVANFEAIYVSVDRTLLEFNDCYGRMPWLAMPTGTTPFKNALTEQLKVIDLPALVVLDPKTGYVVTTNGVAEIEALGDFDAAGAVKLAKVEEDQTSSCIRSQNGCNSEEWQHGTRNCPLGNLIMQDKNCVLARLN
jgi:hypothetical protein